MDDAVFVSVLFLGGASLATGGLGETTSSVELLGCCSCGLARERADSWESSLVEEPDGLSKSRYLATVQHKIQEEMPSLEAGIANCWPVCPVPTRCSRWFWMKNDTRPQKESIASDDSVDEKCRTDFCSEGLFPRTGRSGLPLCASLRPGFQASAVASKIAQIRSYSLLTVYAFQVWTVTASTHPPFLTQLGSISNIENCSQDLPSHCVEMLVPRVLGRH